jgi:hypothetical protein
MYVNEGIVHLVFLGEQNGLMILAVPESRFVCGKYSIVTCSFSSLTE